MTATYALSAVVSVVAVLACFFGVAAAWILLDRGLDRLLAAHRRGVERVRAASVSPDDCRSCGSPYGWHEQGCGVLDRLDRGQVTA